jgi:GxxExxY protein
MAFTVHGKLGPGLLESAYEGAYCVELTYSGIPFERQKVFPLIYRGEYVVHIPFYSATQSGIILPLISP